MNKEYVRERFKHHLALGNGREWAKKQAALDELEQRLGTLALTPRVQGFLRDLLTVSR